VESIQQAVVEITEQLGSEVTKIQRAGLACQRSSIISWDRQSGKALSPVLSWQDRRAANWLAKFQPQQNRLQEITGLRMSPHYGVSKIHWCIQHLAAVAMALQKTQLCCAPLASFLLFRLLNEKPFLVDSVNASRTLLWDLQSAAWSSELLALFKIPRSVLPQSVPNNYKFGHIRVGETDVPLTLVTGDQSAAYYSNASANAIATEAAIHINVGTGAFVQYPLSDKQRCPASLLISVVHQTDNYLQLVMEGTVNGAGSALDWASKKLNISGQEIEIKLNGWLQEFNQPPIFLNGVSGLGSPYWQAEFPSRFIGDGDYKNKLVAVVESIIFLLQRNIEIIFQSGVDTQQIKLSGGLSLAGVCQKLADLLELPVCQNLETEATAKGLFFLLSQKTKDREPSNERVFRPQANSKLHQRYQLWKQAMAEELQARSKN